MTNAQRIKMALAYKGMSEAHLARELDSRLPLLIRD